MVDGALPSGESKGGVKAWFRSNVLGRLGLLGSADRKARNVPQPWPRPETGTDVYVRGRQLDAYLGYVRLARNERVMSWKPQTRDLPDCFEPATFGDWALDFCIELAGRINKLEGAHRKKLQQTGVYTTVTSSDFVAEVRKLYGACVRDEAKYANMGAPSVRDEMTYARYAQDALTDICGNAFGPDFGDAVLDELNQKPLGIRVAAAPRQLPRSAIIATVGLPVPDLV